MSGTISGTGFDEKGQFMITGVVEDDGLMTMDKVYESGDMTTMQLRGSVGMAFMATFIESSQSNGLFEFSENGIFLMKLLTGDQEHDLTRFVLF